MTMTTERAKAAQQRRTAAVNAWVIANDNASRLAPRFMQTAETLPAYELAQAELNVAEIEYSAASWACAEIPSEEY